MLTKSLTTCSVQPRVSVNLLNPKKKRNNKKKTINDMTNLSQCYHTMDETNNIMTSYSYMAPF